MRQKSLRSGLVLLVFAGLFVSLSMEQEHKLEHGLMEQSTPGGEYRVDEPMDHGGHGTMQHSRGLFRAQGVHDQPDLSKPKDMQSLQARGRNIYLHMCVFCH